MCRSGLITEHEGIDGISVARFSERLGTAIDANTPSPASSNGSSLSDHNLHELVLDTNSEIKAHTQLLRGRFLEHTAGGSCALEMLNVRNRVPAQPSAEVEVDKAELETLLQKDTTRMHADVQMTLKGRSYVRFLELVR